MRRTAAWPVVVGVVACMGVPATVRADDGFWVTLAAGAAGASAPSDYSEFWFDSPHAPPIAVTQLTGTGSIQATTGGGNTFFSGAGTPVLLPTGDGGFATLTNPGVPNGSGGLPRFAGGTMASGAPQTGVPVGNANLLSVGLSDPAANGSQVLTVGATDPNGKPLGSGHITVPGGGWWVIGLGDGANTPTTPPPTDPPPTDPGSGSGTGGDTGGSTGGGGGTIIPPIPVPPAQGNGNSGNNGSVATPEPGTMVLLGVGGLSAAGYRRLRRKW